MHGLRDFFVSIFELKNSIWIIVGVLLAPHIELLPQIIEVLKRRMASNHVFQDGERISTNSIAKILGFIFLLGLTVASFIVVWVVIKTRFIQLNNRSGIIEWCSYFNVFSLALLTLFKFPFRRNLVMSYTIQKLILSANTILICIVLSVVIEGIFGEYVFSTAFRQTDNNLYFTIHELYMLTLFYGFNLMLVLFQNMILMFHFQFLCMFHLMTTNE